MRDNIYINGYWTGCFVFLPNTKKKRRNVVLERKITEKKQKNKNRKGNKQRIEIKIICWWCCSTWSLCFFFCSFPLLILPKFQCHYYFTVRIDLLHSGSEIYKNFLQHYAMILSRNHIRCHCCSNNSWCSFHFRFFVYFLCSSSQTEIWFCALVFFFSHWYSYRLFRMFRFYFRSRREPIFWYNHSYSQSIFQEAERKKEGKNICIACIVTQCHHAALWDSTEWISNFSITNA